MFSYFKLIDEINYDTVIKAEGKKQYRYVYGINEWRPTGILLLYHTEGTVEYEQYEKISYEEVCKIIERKKYEFEKLEQWCQKEIKCMTRSPEMYNCFAKPNFEDEEINIVAMLYYIHLCHDIDIKDLQKEGFTNRIIKSLKILIDNTNIEDNEQIENIIDDDCANMIKQQELQILLKTLLPSSQEYLTIKEVVKYMIDGTHQKL